MNRETQERGIFHGVSNIVRFNPWYFVFSGVFLVVSTVGLALLSEVLPTPIKLMAYLGVGLAGWWFFASLFVSWCVYDLSSLYRWTWLATEQTQAVEVIVAAHSGFDEVSEPLKEHFAGRELQAVDFYDAKYMTEKSIQRARRLCPPSEGTIRIARKSSWQLPVRPGLILFILSAHEWRKHEERVEILAGARAALADGGSVMLVEHLRNAANFFAFGPGFLHFHSAKTWQRAWSEAGFSKINEMSITPFVNCFVLNALEGDD